LEAGESKKAETSVSLKYAASFWDEEHDTWILEKDTYDVLVGNSSASTPLKACFGVDTTRWWKGL
jgi:beta-glucosidase